MKKTLLALAVSSATLMTAAHAATVYDADGQTLDVYGKVEADMTHAGADKEANKAQADAKGDLTTSARLGIKGTTRVTDDFDVFGKGEWQVSGQTSDGNEFKTRYAYLGADFHDAGKVSFGQQYTPLYTSLVKTIDIFDQWGMEAQGGIYGETRQASQVVYSNTLGNFDVQAGYQFRNSDNNYNGITNGTQQDNAYSAAAVYHTGIGLNLRGAYARQDFGPNGATTGANSDGKINTYGLGADYTLNDLYLAFVYLGSRADSGASTNADTDTDSYDLVGAYTIDQYRLYTGYGLQTQDADGSSSKDSVKSYKLGVEYNVTSNFLTWVEYRHNNADDNFDGGNGVAKNEFAVSAEYHF